MNEKDLLKKMERIEKMLTVGLSAVMDLEGCALLTGFSKSHLYKLVASREIPHYKRGKCLFFEKKEIEAWLMEERVPTTKEIAETAERMMLDKK